jgi:uncharacterized integral membrane protein
MKGSMIVLVVLLALLALFTVQNPEVVTVRFLGFSGNTLLLVVVVAAFAAGVFGAGIAALPGWFRKRAEGAAANRRIGELEAEVAALKAEIGRLKGAADAKPGPQRPGGAA